MAEKKRDTLKIAVLSDTHDVLHPEVLSLLPGCDAILHAGDVCGQSVLDRLARIAPLYAVRGNNDWSLDRLSVQLVFRLGGLRFCMAHRRQDLPPNLENYDVAVFGHSHQYTEEYLPSPSGKTTLLLNPGSCGPGWFMQYVTLAMLTVGPEGPKAERIDIRL